MKSISYIFFLLLIAMLSCQNDKKENLKNKKAIYQKPSHSQEIENEKTKLSQTIKKDSLDITFIGKTTQDLNQFNFHECFGVMIEGKSEAEKYAISQHSLVIDNCRNGRSKIFLKKFRNYYDQGKANFEIKDEMIVYSNYPKKCYSNIVLKLTENKSEKNYLIEYEDNSKPVLTNVYKLWEVDLDKEKFIEVNVPKNFKSNNPEYADGI